MNSRGYWDSEWPSDKPVGVLRIVVLSDSVGIGTGPYEEKFLTLLEARLNDRYTRPTVEVLNLGIPGTSPPEYALLLAEKWKPLEGDLAIVCFSVADDLISPPPSESMRDPRGWRLAQAALQLWDLGLRRARESRDPTRREREEARARIEAGILRKDALTDSAAERREKSWEYTLAFFDKMREISGGRLIIFNIPEEVQVRSAKLERMLESAGLSRDDVDLYDPQTRVREHGEKILTPVCDVTTSLSVEEEKGTPTFDAEGKNLNAAGHKAAAFNLDMCVNAIR
ncbi:MAG: hypothetical protein ACRD1Z_12585, partial [Vicinamibacteria bacterium]